MAVAVAVAVVAGLLVAGDPSEERERKLDEVRVDALRGLRSAIDDYRRRNGTLPHDLAGLTPPGGPPVLAHDPVRGETYGYAVIDDSTFEVCATFDQASEVDPARMAYDPWAHGAGRRCYRFRIRPDGDAPILEGEPAAPR